MMSEQPTKTKAEVIAERQEAVRREMLLDADDFRLLNLLGTADYEGRATLTRWYLFGQVALYDGGSLLFEDDNWAEIKKEMAIPSSLWIAALQNSLALTDLGSVITDIGAYQFPLTDLGRDGVNPRISAASWWDNRVRNIRRLQVLAWLGIAGGVLPS